MKIAVTLVSVLINLGIAAITLIFLLIAMNGYHESDASWGLGTYLVLMIAAVICLAMISRMALARLIDKGFSLALSTVAAIAGSTVVATIAAIIAGLLCVGVAEIARTRF